MTATTGITKRSSIIAVFALLVLFYSVIGLGLAFFAMLGLPGFVGAAFYLACLYGVFAYADKIQATHISLSNKIESALVSTTNAFSKAKTWVVGLSSKAEAAPEAAVAA